MHRALMLQTQVRVLQILQKSYVLTRNHAETSLSDFNSYQTNAMHRNAFSLWTGTTALSVRCVLNEWESGA